jgi:sortase A
MKRALVWLQRALWASSIVMLGYCGFVLTDSWIFQRQAARQLQFLRTQRATLSPGIPPAEALQGLIGRLDIPRLDISVVVMEGDSASVLRRAAGHITGTALPGQPGNSGISAHRDTFFRPLRNIRRNDEITVSTMLGNYRYLVVSTAIVPPTAIEVLNPGAKESLTLVTCYPFYFIGSAPDRFVVRAERII